MEKTISNYIRRHTIMIATIILGGFILLGFGEYYLYRNQMKLNRMVAEGLMQLKEEKRVESLMMKDQVITRDGKILLRKNGHTTIVNKDEVLPNGVTVSVKGYLLKKDGSKVFLNEGWPIDLE